MQYFSAGKLDFPGPISRFLPPIPDGSARAFIAGLESSTAWILDPFGASPRLTVEMARAGKRVLVTAGNPVSRFLLDLAAHPPRLADLQAALADLAAARKDGKRLEILLQSMYSTRCDSCQRELAAEAFLWDGKTGQLTGRIYNCICGHGGEQPATPADQENAARWARADGLHRSRALERVAPGADPDRASAEDALAFYPARAVYAIGMIINRLDSLSDSDERRRCMSALLLYAADSANALWPHLSERPRPRQLTLPSVYRENNIWLALEAGVKAWASFDDPIPLTLWPQQPPESGGLCVFEGPLRELAPELEEIPIRAVVSAIPRPNQAFWTLSALWAGWLWGHEAVGPFKSVLRRQRYDWQWHAAALKALFGNLKDVMSPETPFFSILAEPEPALVSAVFLAAQSADLQLKGLAMRSESEPVQLLWKKMAAGKQGKSTTARARKKKSLSLDPHYTSKVIREILEKNAQPMAYLHLHNLTLAALSEKGMLQWSDEALSTLEKNFHAALASPELIDLEARSTPENGKWALKKWDHQTRLDEI